MGALSILTTRTGRFDRMMSIGSPVSGDAAIVGGAGTAGGGPAGPKPAGRVAAVVGGATCAFGRVVAVVDVDAFGRVVVVVAFGRVVLVVDDDVVVVGGGLTVSTRRKSVPQALPARRRRTGKMARSRLRCRCGLAGGKGVLPKFTGVMSTEEGSGPEP